MTKEEFIERLILDLGDTAHLPDNEKFAHYQDMYVKGTAQKYFDNIQDKYVKEGKIRPGGQLEDVKEFNNHLNAWFLDLKAAHDKNPVSRRGRKKEEVEGEVTKKDVKNSVKNFEDGYHDFVHYLRDEYKKGTVKKPKNAKEYENLYRTFATESVKEDVDIDADTIHNMLEDAEHDVE